MLLLLRKLGSQGGRKERKTKKTKNGEAPSVKYPQKSVVGGATFLINAESRCQRMGPRQSLVGILPQPTPTLLRKENELITRGLEQSPTKSMTQAHIFCRKEGRLDTEGFQDRCTARRASHKPSTFKIPCEGRPALKIGIPLSETFRNRSLVFKKPQ